MTLENRCSHPIVVDAGGRQRLIEPTAPHVRIETTPGAPVGFADGIPVHAPPGFKRISHLPPRRDGVIVIVSQLVGLAVAALLPDRSDVVYPGTAPSDGACRNHRGVVSVCRLIRAV